MVLLLLFLNFQKLFKKGRYTSKNFKIYSRNYSKLYGDLQLNKQIKELIN